jgi:hypothetical protein
MAGTIKAIYQTGLNHQGISIHSQSKPELRGRSGIAQHFRNHPGVFEALGAELSYARVRRPTDNAVTEGFYWTIKQEEIYLVGNYPDELSAKEEIGRYIERYHHSRPHQLLNNFTPAHVHEGNNKSRLLAELQEMKLNTREERKAYRTEQRKLKAAPSEGDVQIRASVRSSILGANTEAVFQHQLPDSQIESPTTENFSLDQSVLSH